MEEQILRYYLKIYSLAIILFLLFITLYLNFILNKKILLIDNSFTIKKGEEISSILENNIINLNKLDYFLIGNYYKFNNIINNAYIHYGDFIVENETSLIKLINIITKPSNVINKVTIVEGWSKKRVQKEFLKHFYDAIYIEYEDFIADTYFYQKNENFDTFIKKLKFEKDQYFNNFINHKLLKKYSIKEIMIIGSLLEKEGLDDKDKKLISSVIFNRLDKKMKLQIDATVLFAITNGNYDLNRKLLLEDLKINSPFNTYKNFGLPPRPISYVGRRTLDIIFENYKSEFLFYFFDNSLKKHIFSKNYKNHLEKLNAYRSKK